MFFTTRAKLFVLFTFASFLAGNVKSDSASGCCASWYGQDDKPCSDCTGTFLDANNFTCMFVTLKQNNYYSFNFHALGPHGAQGGGQKWRASGVFQARAPQIVFDKQEVCREGGSNVFLVLVISKSFWSLFNLWMLLFC